MDALPCDIQYTNNNQTRYFHKGVNELLDIKFIIDKYNIQDEDIIIKLTGRYYLTNDTFFKLVIENPNCDVFIKFFNVCTLQFMYNDCVLGLYAIKCKYLKRFNYYPINKSAEVQFATFIHNHISNIFFISAI